MSQLQIRTNNFGNFSLNVIAFSSPLSGTIGGTQVKKMKLWYPIKANQPEINFDVQFVGEQDYELFQKFVRESQQWALTASYPMVTLNWPERNINNWTGLILNFNAGGMRFNYAPRAQFTVSLVDSYVSQYTQASSIGAVFENSFNFVFKPFLNLLPNPFNLQLPRPNNNQYAPGTSGDQNQNSPNTVEPRVNGR